MLCMIDPTCRFSNITNEAPTKKELVTYQDSTEYTRRLYHKRKLVIRDGTTSSVVCCMLARPFWISDGEMRVGRVGSISLLISPPHFNLSGSSNNNTIVWVCLSLRSLRGGKWKSLTELERKFRKDRMVDLQVSMDSSTNLLPHQEEGRCILKGSRMLTFQSRYVSLVLPVYECLCKYVWFWLLFSHTHKTNISSAILESEWIMD